jgi:hypothetical protein
MRGRRGAALVLASLSSLAHGGCAEDETAILLSICTNLAPEQADLLLIQVSKGDVSDVKPFGVPDIRLSQQPFAISLRPGARINGAFEIRVSLENEGTLVVERRVATSFLEGEDRDVTVLLDSSCIDQFCGEEQTCDKGSCGVIGPGDDACGSASGDGGVGCDEPDRDGDQYDSIPCGGDDCDDDNFEVHPDAPEICDQLDNDCANGADDGLWIAGPETYASYAFTDEQAPTIFYGADVYGIAWRATRSCTIDEECGSLACTDGQCRDLQELRFVAFDSVVGTPPTENQIVLSGDDPFVGEPSIGWSGVDWAIAYEDQAGGPLAIFFARVDSASRPLGAPGQISEGGEGSYAPALTWGRRTWGAVWSEVVGGQSLLRFAEMDTVGTVRGEAAISPDGQDAYAGVLDWGEEQYGIGWVSADGVVWLQLASDQGVPDGEAIQLSAPGAFVGSSLDVVWAGDGWVVVWEQYADGVSQIFSSRLDVDGVPEGQPTQIVQTGHAALSPALASSDLELALVWSDGEEGDAQVLLQRLSLQGQPLGPPIRMIRSAEARGSRPAITWNPDSFEYGVVWQDQRLANDTDVWFNRLYCDDGDG